MTQLLLREPSRRPTAEQLSRHPWLHRASHPQIPPLACPGPPTGGESPHLYLRPLLAGEILSPSRPAGSPGGGGNQGGRSSLAPSPQSADSDPEEAQPCRSSRSNLGLQGEAGPSQALFGLGRVDPPLDLHEQAQILDPMPVQQLDPVDPTSPMDPADLPAGPSDTDTEPDQWPDIDACRQGGCCASGGSGGSGKGRSGEDKGPIDANAVLIHGHSLGEANRQSCSEGPLWSCLNQAWMGPSALSGEDGANGLPGHRHSLGGNGRLHQLEPCGGQDDGGNGPQQHHWGRQQQQWGQQRQWEQQREQQRRLSLQHQPRGSGLLLQPRGAVLLVPQQPAAWWAPPPVADVAPGTVPLMHSGGGLHTLMLLPALPDSWR